jgi:hypothetical protein
MNKQAWIKCYNETGKLPEQKVPCTKCGTGVTMFSSNLTNRVTKFGGVDKLLSNFICKQCSSVGKPQKVKPLPKPKQVKATVEIHDIPIYKGRNIVPIDLHVTKDNATLSCWRPDLYLNADKTCDDCTLFNICQCALKKLSKRKMALITD